MKKIIFSILISVFTNSIATAQVGINTTLPDAQLDIRSSNQATPSNTDGILIPKIDAFPVTNPTLAQKGMLVYLTTISGLNQPGFIIGTIQVG
jgi:trimeric autotransporter adhesin